MNYSEQLNEWMRASGTTNKALAAALNTDTTQVSRWRNRAQPCRDRQVEIAAISRGAVPVAPCPHCGHTYGGAHEEG